jgi:hypothetical protein
VLSVGKSAPHPASPSSAAKLDQLVPSHVTEYRNLQLEVAGVLELLLLELLEELLLDEEDGQQPSDAAVTPSGGYPG